MAALAPHGNLSCMLAGAKKVDFVDWPVPRVDDPHDVLIKIAYTGVCGSDVSITRRNIFSSCFRVWTSTFLPIRSTLHRLERQANVDQVHFWLHGGISTYMIDQPLIMGHEASGVVAAVGSAVTTLRPGDKVSVEPGFPCRWCSRCKEGKYHLCPDMKFAASPPTTHGTLTKIFKSPEDYCYKLPQAMSLQEGVLIEPLAVAVHALRLAGPMDPRRAVVVFGAGTVGLLCGRTAKALGADRVSMVDISPVRLDFAASYVGCQTFAVDLTQTAQQVAQSIRDKHSLTPNCVTVVVDASGAESSMRVGVELLQTGGTFVQVGMGKDEVMYPIMSVCTKELTIKGSFRYGHGDYADAVALASSGKVTVKELITKVVPFNDTVTAWDTTRRGEGIKTLIKVMDD